MKLRPISKLKVVTVRFFKCDHVQEIVMSSSEEDIGAGDVIVCNKCKAMRLVMEATTRIEKGNYVIVDSAD